MCKVVTHIMREIKKRGTTKRLVDNMVTLVELFETVGLSEALALDARFAVAT